MKLYRSVRLRRDRRNQHKTSYTVAWRDYDGAQRQESYDTQREAAARMAEVVAAQRTGAPATSAISFAAAQAAFSRAQSVNLRASTRKDAVAIAARCAAYFGGRPLRNISRQSIEEFRDAELQKMRDEAGARFDRTLARDRTKPEAQRRFAPDDIARVRAQIAQRGVRTANKCVGYLRALLAFAQGEGHIGANPAQRVKMLRATTAHSDAPQQHAILTPAEVQRLVGAADADWRAALMVAVYGGPRLGELLGLQWGDVEFSANRILVRQQLEAVTGELRTPKTRAGTRFIELPRFVMAELKQWKLRCPPGPLDLCFPDSRGGPMDSRNLRSRVFGPALRRAGLRRIRIHDLRHTHASHLIATGADLAAISRQLGHANAAITLSTYTHAFAKRNESGLGALLEAFIRDEVGGELVANANQAPPEGAQIVELMVARGGIEPPTRGFSVRCSTN